MVVMTKALHHLIEQTGSIFLSLLGKVQIDHSGFQGIKSHPLERIAVVSVKFSKLIMVLATR